MSSSSFTLLYFAAATSYTRKQHETFSAPLPVTELYSILEMQYPGITEKVLDSSALTVNLDYVDVTEESDKGERGLIINAGDEVAIIPPHTPLRRQRNYKVELKPSWSVRSSFTHLTMARQIAQTIFYKTVGSVDIPLDIYLPATATNVPVLLWFHGGGLLQNKRTNISPHHLRGVEKYQYAFVSADYRLAPQVGIADIFEDVRDCIAFVRGGLGMHIGKDVVDTSRLAVSGSSAGGYLAFLAGLYVEPKPSLILPIYPITDPLGTFFTTPQVKPFAGSQTSKDVVAPFLDPNGEVVTDCSKTSSRNHLYTWMQQEAILKDLLHIRPGDNKFRIAKNIYEHKLPPTYVVHGDIDTAVGVEQTDEVVGVMKGLNMEVEYERLHGVEHLFDREDTIELDRMYQFFLQHVSQISSEALTFAIADTRSVACASRSRWERHPISPRHRPLTVCTSNMAANQIDPRLVDPSGSTQQYAELASKSPQPQQEQQHSQQHSHPHQQHSIQDPAAYPKQPSQPYYQYPGPPPPAPQQQTSQYHESVESGEQSDLQDGRYHYPVGPESPEQDEGQSLEDLKRPRACEACRGLKVRCDQDPAHPEIPCKRCAKAGRPCVITQPSRKRQKKADSRVAELEKKLDALTAVLHQQQQQPGQAPRRGLGELSQNSSTHSPAVTSNYTMVDTPMSSHKRRRTEDEDAREVQTYDRDDTVAKDLSDQRPDPGQMLRDFEQSWVGNIDLKTYLHRTSPEEFVNRINALISPHQAATLVERYKTQLCPNLPAIVIPPDATAESIFKEKPILYVCILSAASFGVLNINTCEAITSEAVGAIADCVVRNGAKSLELIQAMQVIALWYKPPEQAEQTNFYQLLHMAAVMALDIGLGKRFNPAKARRGFGGPNANFIPGPQKTLPQDSDTLEARRAWLTCYYLSAR
nr:molybdopterin synthase sulfur carrier subunit [Quercus suber]